MSQRFICRILLLFALVATVCSADAPAGGDESGGSSEVAKPVAIPPGVKEPKTNGIIGNLLKAFWPLTEILLQLFESYLKNMYGKSLPCRLESFTPLKGECTDLKTA